MVVIEELSDDNIEPITACRQPSTATQTTRGTAPMSPNSATPSSEANCDRLRSKECTANFTAEAPSANSSVGSHEPNVFCNIYDITPRLNCLLRCCGFGIYHTGVEVYGKEFAFGGHQHESTGVWAGTPQAIQGAVFRKRVPVGWTNMDPWALRKKIATMAPQWSGKSYETLTRNCHNFTEALCAELTGESPPPYVNRCAKSCCVKKLFYNCVLPLSRCLERCGLVPAFVTYQTEDEKKPTDQGEEFCVSGARGMNQVLIEAATVQKNEANSFFRVGAYEQAGTGYMQALFLLQAISRLDEDDEHDMQVLKQASEVCKAILLNIAACQLKTENWDGCIFYCNRVLDGDSMTAEAYFRRGVAHSHIGKIAEPLADLQRALQLTNPSDATTCEHIKKEVDRVMAMRQSVPPPAVPRPNTPQQLQT